MKKIFFATFLALFCAGQQLSAQTEQKPIARYKAFDDDKTIIVRIYEDTLYSAELVIPYPCPLQSISGFTCDLLSSDTRLSQSSLEDPIIFYSMKGINLQNIYVESQYCVYYQAGVGWYQVNSMGEVVEMNCESVVSFPVEVEVIKK